MLFNFIGLDIVITRNNHVDQEAFSSFFLFCFVLSCFFNDSGVQIDDIKDLLFLGGGMSLLITLSVAVLFVVDCKFILPTQAVLTLFLSKHPSSANDMGDIFQPHPIQTVCICPNPLVDRCYSGQNQYSGLGLWRLPVSGLLVSCFSFSFVNRSYESFVLMALMSFSNCP